MKNYMLAAIGISVLAVSGCLCSLILTTRKVEASIPIEIQATRAALIDQVTRVRIEVLAEIDTQATALRHDTTAQLNVIRKDALVEIRNTRSMADLQLTGTRSDLKKSIAAIVAPVEGLRADLKPVLMNAAALTKDAQDSWDDSYDDVRSLLGSAEVATTQTAQTMQTVNAIAPKFLAAAQETNQHFAGITADVHDATHSLDTKYFHPPPQTRKQKVLGFFSNFEALLIAALRGGVI
jgi:hypothetical protein